jgi:hypothetical protein
MRTHTFDETLKFDNNRIEIEVTGEYYAGTPDSYMEKGDDPEIEIHTINMIKGDMQDLLEAKINIDDIYEALFIQLG